MNISEISNDAAAQQFYLLADGHKAFIDYSKNNGRYQLLHSEVPEALRGQGIGRILVERTFNAIANVGETAFARCGYIRQVAKNSGQWEGVIDL